MDRLIGEVAWFAFSETPKMWKACNGSFIPANQNQGLFSLVGTVYGEKPGNQFGLPDMRGSVPVNQGELKSEPGKSFALGQTGGEAVHSLTPAEMPKHTHTAYGSTERASLQGPADNFWAADSGKTPYSNTANEPMANEAVTFTGGTPSGANGNAQPHENRPPFLTLNYSIRTEGIYPARDGGKTDMAFTGEIGLFAGNFAPSGWAFCEGQEIAINENTALFAIIGNTYGGNGNTTFKLPDFTGRAALGAGQGPGLTDRPQGSAGGQTTVQLTTDQMPPHTHVARCTTSAGNRADPGSSLWALAEGETRGGVPMYSTTGPLVPMNPNALVHAGGDGAHNNLAPYQALNYIICINGEFPHFA